MLLLLSYAFPPRTDGNELKQINTLVSEAQTQLIDYEKDEMVTTYLKDGLKIQKVVIVFWGWEMVYCEVGNS